MKGTACIRSLTLVGALGALALTAVACGGGNGVSLVPAGDTGSGGGPGSTSSGSSIPGLALTNALLNGSFPAVHLSVRVGPPSKLDTANPYSEPETGGAQAEIFTNLNGSNSENSVTFFLFTSTGDASGFASKPDVNGPTIASHGEPLSATIDGTSAQCAQFTEFGRPYGGTECWASVGSVVVFGQSAIENTQSGSASDARALLTAGIRYLASVQRRG